MESGVVIAILPCNDLDASERFCESKDDRRKRWRPTGCYPTAAGDFT
jgi:hypothetical protein